MCRFKDERFRGEVRERQAEAGLDASNSQTFAQLRSSAFTALQLA